MRRLSLAVTALALFAPGCAREWTEFTSAEDGFKAAFPAPVKMQPVVAGESYTRAYAAVVGHGVATVAVTPIDESLSKSADGGVAQLERARDAMARQLRIDPKAVASEPAERGGLKGLKFEAELPDDAGRVRAELYAGPKRLYQVIVSGRRAWADSPDASRFLASFAPGEVKEPK